MKVPIAIPAAVCAAIFALAAIASAQSSATIRGQNSGATLELPAVVPHRQFTPSPQSAPSNVRIIPVIPPSQKVLVLPGVSPDFVGLWGGRLMLTRRYGPVKTPAQTSMSLAFGERSGEVVMATYVYGGPSTQILKTKVQSAGAHDVTLIVAGVTIGARLAIRHHERVTLQLNGRNRLECVKHVDLYVPGRTEPILEAVYKGTLHPISRQESRLLAEQAARSGAVPLAHIQRGNPSP